MSPSPESLAVIPAPSAGPMASGLLANRKRSGYGKLSTHCRTGHGPNTSSTRCRADSAMRRAPQLGQKPRRLQLNATRRSAWQCSHTTRTKPRSSTPQRKYASNSSRTCIGGMRPSQGGRVVAHQPVKARVFRNVACVARRCGRRAQWRGSARHGNAQCLRPSARTASAFAATWAGKFPTDRTRYPCPLCGKRGGPHRLEQVTSIHGIPPAGKRERGFQAAPAGRNRPNGRDARSAAR